MTRATLPTLLLDATRWRPWSPLGVVLAPTAGAHGPWERRRLHLVRRRAPRPPSSGSSPGYSVATTGSSWSTTAARRSSCRDTRVSRFCASVERRLRERPLAGDLPHPPSVSGLGGAPRGRRPECCPAMEASRRGGDLRLERSSDPLDGPGSARRPRGPAEDPARLSVAGTGERRRIALRNQRHPRLPPIAAHSQRPRLGAACCRGRRERACPTGAAGDPPPCAAGRLPWSLRRRNQRRAVAARRTCRPSLSVQLILRPERP